MTLRSILIRRSSPALNIQQAIADFKICPLDSEEEKRIQEEIKRWKDYEADIDRLNEEMKQVQKDVIEVRKEVEAKITGVEKQLEAIEKRQDEGLILYEREDRRTPRNAPVGVYPIQRDEDKYQIRKKELQDDLIKFYRKRGCSIPPLSQLLEEIETPQKTVLEKCRNVQDILDMSKMCNFISKMNADWICTLSNDLMSVINEDEETRDYRTRTCDEIPLNRYPLYNLQEMFMSCLQEMPASANIHLCLQDFFIDEDTEYSEQLQRLFKQNKTNIKSLYINTDTDDTPSSLLEIIVFFSLTDLRHIQKLYLSGNMKEMKINRILFPSLQAVALLQGNWTKDEGNLSENMLQCQNLQYLDISNFMFSHKILETIFNFISGQKSMKELTLRWLHCKEPNRHDCTRVSLDLSQQLTLKMLYLRALPWRLQLNISTINRPRINLDASSLLLAHDMLNIERVDLWEMEMYTGSLQNLSTVLENLPQSVTVLMGHIKPKKEYKRFKQNIRSSQRFDVIIDSSWIKFKTIKPRKEFTENELQ